MNKAFELFKLIRPLNVLITFLVVSIGYIISAEGGISLFLLFAAAISASLTAASGNIVNDIFDTNADKINHPARPLASGKISYNSAKVVWFVCTFLSFTISSFINLYAFLFVLGIHVLLIFYSYRLKATVLSGNLLISFITGLAFVYGALPSGNYRNIIVPAVFAFILNFIREIVKDIQDIRGDRMYGILTLPVRFGIEPAKKIIIIFIILLLMLTFYAFFTDYYNIEFFIIMMIIVNPFMLYITKLFYTRDSDINTLRISKILKFNMVIGLLAVYIGR